MESSVKPKNVMFMVGSMGGGGAERQILEIIKRLDRARFRPVLYLSHRKGELLDEVPADVPIHSFWDDFAGTLRSKIHYLLGTTDRARWQNLARTLRREQIDLLYDRCYLATLETAPATKAARVPRVSVCVYDPLDDVTRSAGSSLAAAMHTATNAYLTADRVISISNGIRQQLIDDLGVPGDLIEVHYNLLDFDKAQHRAIEYDPGLEPGRFHLLTVARLAEEKGHKYLLEALDVLVNQRGHRELLWHVVGVGPLEEDLKAEVSRRGLGAHVHFAGFQRNPYPFYRHSHLFCLPSLHEGFASVLMEALAVNLPVLSADCPSGPNEVLDHGRCGRLVPPADSAALVEAIEDCLTNREAWRDRTTAGRLWVNQAFSMEAGVARLEDLFDSVIERRQGVAHRTG